MVIAIALALLVNIRVPGIGAIRSALYIPNIISLTAVSMIWLWMYSQNGLFNQVFDFFGMYFFFNLVLLLNLVRMGTVKPQAFFKTLYISIISLTVFTVLVAKTPFPIQGIVVVLLVGTLTTEVLASRRASEPVSHRFLYLCLVFIAVAFAFSASDASRLRCDPSDHLFPGHAVWHEFGAVSMIFAFLHYRQFARLFA